MTSADLQLDPDLTTRIQRLADARHRSADAIMREAIEQYLEREKTHAEPQHPSGKSWPQ